MEETDAASWTGGADSVPEVLSPPTRAAQLHSAATARLLCPYWNGGSVSLNIFFSPSPSSMWRLYILCLATFRKCVQGHSWLNRSRSETRMSQMKPNSIGGFFSLTDRREWWFRMWCDAAWRRWSAGAWTRLGFTGFQEPAVKSACSKLPSTAVRTRFSLDTQCVSALKEGSLC